MAEVRVPVLDSSGKVATRFWPDAVSNLEANTQIIVEQVAPPLIAAAVAEAVTNIFVSTTLPTTLGEGDGWLDTSAAV